MKSWWHRGASSNCVASMSYSREVLNNYWCWTLEPNKIVGIFLLTSWRGDAAAAACCPQKSVPDSHCWHRSIPGDIHYNDKWTEAALSWLCRYFVFWSWLCPPPTPSSNYSAVASASPQLLSFVIILTMQTNFVVGVYVYSHNFWHLVTPVCYHHSIPHSKAGHSFLFSCPAADGLLLMTC